MNKKKTSKQDENQTANADNKAQETQQKDRYTASERAADFKKYEQLKKK